MEIRTGNYSDIIRIEKFRDKWQLVLCTEYNGEIKPQWCTLKRGAKEIVVPISIALAETDEGAVDILKQIVAFIGGTASAEPEQQPALPGHGTPRYGAGRRM